MTDDDDDRCPACGQFFTAARTRHEQAKGILVWTLGIPEDDAWQLIRRYSQNHNQKVTAVSRQLIRRQIDIKDFLTRRPLEPWTPPPPTNSTT